MAILATAAVIWIVLLALSLFPALIDRMDARRAASSPPDDRTPLELLQASRRRR